MVGNEYKGLSVFHFVFHEEYTWVYYSITSNQRIDTSLS